MGRRTIPLLLCGGFLLGTGGIAVHGGEEAVFLDGRTLQLERHRFVGDQVILELEGGGRITIPRARIRTFRHGDRPEEPVEAVVESQTTLAVETRTAGENGLPPRGVPENPPDLFPIIARLALKYGLDAQLVAAVAWVESGLDPEAVSPKGAQGLMQLMPETAGMHGVRDPFDPIENLEAGISHLRELLDRYHGDLELSLAGYNAGEAAVARYGGVPPYPETVRFIRRVLALARAR